MNAVSAGVVETGALEHFPNREEMLASGAGNPAGRLVTPDDIAGVVSFLCSPDAEMIRGQTVVIDGGWSLPAGLMRACDRRCRRSRTPSERSDRRRERRLPLVLDWDGTVTEVDSLHMLIERFGDLEVFLALEGELGRPADAPRGDRARAGDRDRAARRGRRVARGARRVRPGFRELVAEHDPLIVSAGFHETIEPILRRERMEASVVANHVTAIPTGGARRSGAGELRRPATSGASGRRSPGSARTSTSVTASPTAASRSRPSGASPGTGSRAGSTSGASPTSRSTTCTTSAALGARRCSARRGGCPTRSRTPGGRNRGNEAVATATAGAFRGLPRRSGDQAAGFGFCRIPPGEQETVPATAEGVDRRRSLSSIKTGRAVGNPHGRRRRGTD